MGYYIKHLPNKKSDPKWKVQYSEFVAEFERIFIRKKDSQMEQGLRKNTRGHTV